MMVLVFKIALIIIMLISFMGAMADSDKELRKTMTAICLASMSAMFATFIIL